MQRIILLITTVLLTACASQPSDRDSQAVLTYYDYQLASPSGQAISLNQLPDELSQADVILIGEWHTHSGVHRFQTDLLKSLSNNNPNIAVSMEQFTRNHQGVLNAYLAGEIGEQTLMSKAAAWPNYESDYRPLVELAKTNRLDIIASNAPKPVVQCIGRQGLGYLDSLDDQERAFLAKDIDTSGSPYKDKFMASLHHGSPEQTEKQYAAQIAWDETMAESIVNYLASNPDKSIVHIAGKFHTEGGLGTAASILKRSPDLKVIVITPVSELTMDSVDYQLQVLDPPTRFVKPENRMLAYKKLAGRSKGLSCN